MTPMKIDQLSRSPFLPPPLSSYVQNSSNLLTLDVQFQTKPPVPFPLETIRNQLKGNIILRWLLYIIRSFLQVHSRFEYQLINPVWLSIDLWFNWSQSCPQSKFKKLKISFLLSPYSENTLIDAFRRWSQGWAEVSLTAFSWLYILVCAAVPKYLEISP